MKQITIKFSFDSKNYVRMAVINDDINKDMILADHPMNEKVSAESGMAEQLFIWNINFHEPDGSEIECDFTAVPMEDGYEHLTLDPFEVLLWDSKGKCMNNETVKFTVEFADL